MSFFYLLVEVVDLLGYNLHFGPNLSLDKGVNLRPGDQINNCIGQHVRLLLVDFLVENYDFQEFLTFFKILFRVLKDLAKKIKRTLDGHIEFEKV